MLMPIVFSIIAITAAATLPEKSPGKESVSDRDRRLIKRINAGDRKAFDELFKHYQGFVIKLLSTFMRGSVFQFNQEDMEELVNNVNLQLYKSLAGFQMMAKLTTWIYPVVYRAFLHYCDRKVEDDKVRSEEIPLYSCGADGELREVEIPDFRFSPERVAMEAEQAALLDEAIMSLSVKFRHVYILSEIENRSDENIAATLGIPLGTVKSRLNRAKEKLKKKLGNDSMSQ